MPSAVMGVGVWLLSFPLLTEHAQTPVSTATPAITAAAPESAYTGPRQFRNVRPPLAVGELFVPVVGELYQPPVFVPPPPPRPRPAPAAPPAPAPAPPAPAQVKVGANQLYIPEVGINLQVGDYTDCTGATGVPHWNAWRWTCAGTNNTYLLGHNPGVFTPILQLKVGDLIQYGDPSGVVHTYRVTFTEIVSDTNTTVADALPVPSLTLQTCSDYFGTQDFIVRAVQI